MKLTLLLHKLVLATIVGLLFACGGGGGSNDLAERQADTEDGSSVRGLNTSNAIRIMPIGDSITEGKNGQNTYRYFLYQYLVDNGFDVDFVGARTGVFGGGEPDPNYDRDHCAHWGWRSDEFIEYGFSVWAPQYPTDIALIHLGTNDMRLGYDVGHTLLQFSRIIELLRTANPNVIVFIAQIIPARGSNFQIDALNAAIPTYVESVTTEASPVIVVDQNTGFSENTDLADGIHPSTPGEIKMAGVWFNAIAPYLDSGSQEEILEE